MKQKWKPVQFVEISMHEIFCFQDKLDKVKDSPIDVWGVVDDFFMEVENQLELDPKFLEELGRIINIESLESIEIGELEEYLKKECGEDYNPSHIDVIKEYIDYKKS